MLRATAAAKAAAAATAAATGEQLPGSGAAVLFSELAEVDAILAALLLFGGGARVRWAQPRTPLCAERCVFTGHGLYDMMILERARCADST